jgi:hypothetical protein
MKKSVSGWMLDDGRAIEPAGSSPPCQGSRSLPAMPGQYYLPKPAYLVSAMNNCGSRSGSRPMRSMTVYWWSKMSAAC